MSIFRLLPLVRANIYYYIIVVYRYYARYYIVRNIFFGYIYPIGKLYMYKVNHYLTKSPTRWGYFRENRRQETKNLCIVLRISIDNHTRPSR